MLALVTAALAPGIAGGHAVLQRAEPPVESKLKRGPEEVKLYFDSQTHLPLALRFPRETEKGEPVNAENRFFKYIEIGGVKVPYVVDLYENGAQVLRLNYEEREFNVSIPEKIFTKPESVKSLK